ncbi:MAG TPA: OpcA/G6PD domain-containing protein [Candidatus Babeliales bacterium]|nr:OpcA/G6PD domain-containing protein [Candidatus Babeliales bacterium]
MTLERVDARVATQTLVVFFENSSIGELARDRIRRLASKHPSRVVILDAAQSESMHRIEGSDWVELGVSGTPPEALRSAVDTLRVADTPVVLLWIAPGIGTDPRFEMLCDGVQTVVYNSSLLDLGHEALCELVDYVARHPAIPITDIAYLRLAPWQECVAIFFDGKDVAELAAVRRVEIGCGSDPEAFYLLGWLASRLGWTPSENDALVDRSGNRINFEIRREGDPRRIARIAISSSRATFSAEIDKSEPTILLSVTGPDRHATRYRAINDPGIAALVERAILRGRKDKVFHDALAAAGEILAKQRN